MKHTLSVLAIVTILFFLQGCTRLVDWAKDSFNQGENVYFNKTMVQQYIRSVMIYDQFTTQAHFDALWLSDQVRTAYAQVYSIKHGKTEEKKRSFLRRQLAENQHFMVFYLLSSTETSFGDSLSDWSVYLQVGERFFEPVEIKAFDLEPEYRAFFGKRYNRFRIPYRIKFEAKGVDGEPVLSDDVRWLSLHLKSFDKKAVFEWSITHNNK